MDNASSNSAGGHGSKSLMPRRNLHDDAEFDITAMVDLVFMMNIYFLVTFIAQAGEFDLPTASHAVALDMDMAVVVTVMEDLNDETVTVYLGDGEKGEALHESEDQNRLVRSMVQEAVAAGKTEVLFKAEKAVCLRHMYRLMTAAKLDEVKLHVAVMEMDASS